VGYYQWSQINLEMRGGTRNCVNVYSLRSARNLFYLTSDIPALAIDFSAMSTILRSNQELVRPTSFWWSEMENLINPRFVSGIDRPLFAPVIQPRFVSKAVPASKLENTNAEIPEIMPVPDPSLRVCAIFNRSLFSAPAEE
jgi:hypothetical protein